MDNATLHLLARVYVRYRGGLDVNFPECQDIERILNEAGHCNVADMRNPNIVALFASPAIEDEVSVESIEPPRRGRRKVQDEGTDESGE